MPCSLSLSTVCVCERVNTESPAVYFTELQCSVYSSSTRFVMFYHVFYAVYIHNAVKYGALEIASLLRNS